MGVLYFRRLQFRFAHAYPVASLRNPYDRRPLIVPAMGPEEAEGVGNVFGM